MHAKGRGKRGGGAVRVEFDETFHSPLVESDEALSLSEAFAELEKKDAEWAKVMELKFFGGLTYPEIAEVMQMSESSVKRKFNAARIWLFNANKKETK